MNRFLPAIPAFLLCFAGGMVLPRSESRPVGVPAVATVLPPDATGWDEWRAECRNAVAGRDALAKNAAEAEGLGQKLERARYVDAKLAECLKNLNKVEDEYVRAAKDNEDALKAITKEKGVHDEALGALAKAAAELDKSKDAAFEDRLKVWKAYERAWLEYDGTFKAYSQYLDGLKSKGWTLKETP